MLLIETTSWDLCPNVHFVSCWTLLERNGCNTYMHYAIKTVLAATTIDTPAEPLPLANLVGLQVLGLDQIGQCCGSADGLCAAEQTSHGLRTLASSAA